MTAKTGISLRSAQSTKRTRFSISNRAILLPQWGRLIFHVPDVDRFWGYLKGKGLLPEAPRDASWGERYFHLSDPDGHELSIAHPIYSLPMGA